MPRSTRYPSVRAFCVCVSFRAACRLLLGGFVSLALAGSSLTARADEELTLELPPSLGAQAARAAEKAKAQATASTSVVPQKYRTPRSRASRGNYPSRGGNGRERVVGQLGQLEALTPIYRKRSQRSAVLTEAPAGTYLALQEEIGEWYGVLMEDGSTGWVSKQSVRSLAYQVTTTANSLMFPTGADAGDNFPRTGTPFFNPQDAESLLRDAYRYLGVRYVWGGNTTRGIDCSGFIKNVFASLGYSLPRLGSDQMAYGVPVPVNELQAGDRLYFERRTDRLGIKHTGLYIGNGYFIHASGSRKQVAIDSLTDAKWMRLFVCARR